MLNSGDDISMIADWLSENMQIPRTAIQLDKRVIEKLLLQNETGNVDRPSHNACKGGTAWQF